GEGQAASAGEDEAEEDRTILITAEACSEASSETVLRYDRNGDQHYDVVSAFIKSIRGSDVDAALHYLARMIVAGEDPRFIARRIVISAAEDIGMADPQALPIAVAASTAVQNIGMPEGRIPLAEAVTYLALAPKSNASYRALDAAIADVKNGLAGQVPTHLRDAHYPGAKELGHGQGYKYSHDYPHGVADQEYLPETLRGKRYYTPSTNGMERTMAERLENLNRVPPPGTPLPPLEPGMCCHRGLRRSSFDADEAPAQDRPGRGRARRTAWHTSSPPSLPPWRSGSSPMKSASRPPSGSW